ncbi:MAG: polysaccharide deacetylase family protein [Faecalicoccus sp.]|nr:polysaccharide deacetylase family protein [Faecalicoccus sp.]
MKRRVNYVRLLILLLPLLGVLGGFVYFYTHPLMIRAKNREVELAGESVNPKDDIIFSFLADENDVTVEGTVDTSKAGTYPVTLKCRFQSKTITYIVTDTTPPELTLKSIETDTYQEVKPKQFVKECKDASEVTFSFKEEPTNKSGKQTVVIVATDAYNNTTEQDAELTRIEDKTAPKVSGTKDIKLRPGESVDLTSGVEASDDMDSKPKITVDDSQVDYNTPGEYEVVYIAADRSGNETRETVTLTIEQDSEEGAEYTSNKVVYLTFDDGPSNVTPTILDILDTYNVKATFFVTGNGQQYNDYIVKAYKAGHQIGLHTYTHEFSYVYSSVDNYFEDLNSISNMVEELTGYHSNIIRFPGGSSNTISDNYSYGIMTELTQMVTDQGYYYFDWNVDSGDASAIGVDPSVIIENACLGTGDSLVILMHDTFGKETTAEALPTIIEYYQSQGYSFATLNEYSPECHHR